MAEISKPVNFNSTFQFQFVSHWIGTEKNKFEIGTRSIAIGRWSKSPTASAHKKTPQKQPKIEFLKKELCWKNAHRFIGDHFKLIQVKLEAVSTDSSRVNRHLLNSGKVLTPAALGFLFLSFIFWDSLGSFWDFSSFFWDLSGFLTCRSFRKCHWTKKKKSKKNRPVLATETFVNRWKTLTGSLTIWLI